jgi:hypothetical protein
MARKKLGHVELQWTCPNCGGINPGPEKTCQACGAPQPEDVEFEQASRQELITDEEKIARAEAGADIHCPYCGTRNRAGVTTCSQCGGDLSEGTLRKTGRVVGAYKTGPVEQVPCPHCSSENPDTAKTCQQCGGNMHLEAPQEGTPSAKPIQKPRRWLIIGIVAVVVLVCGLLAYFFTRTEELTGTVQSVQWERSVSIEALGPVTHQAWLDQIPAEAELGACHDELRNMQSEPAAGAVEVCGTPYTVDTGDGYGEVVQDCEYHLYDDYCDYTVIEWGVVDTVVLNGGDYNPQWPEPVLGEEQRLGEERTEQYVVVFKTGDQTYTYTTSNFELFQQAQPGTTWILNINTFGGVQSIER